MAQAKKEPKFGEGHVDAMLRQGLAELRGALYPGSNVAQPGQYGLYGTLTPGEVADDRKLEKRDSNEEPKSIVEERVEQARDYGSEPEPPQQERDV